MSNEVIVIARPPRRGFRIALIIGAVLTVAALTSSLLAAGMASPSDQEAAAVSGAAPSGPVMAGAPAAAPGSLTAAARANCKKKPPRKCTSRACKKRHKKKYRACKAKNRAAATPTPAPTPTPTPAPAPAPRASMTYTLVTAGSPTADQADAYRRIRAAMDVAVARYNRHAAFQRHLYVHYAPGVPTAEGGGNDIRFGTNRRYMNERTALHEISHTVGVGISARWFQLCGNGNGSGQWTGTQARGLVKSWDGPGAEINCGGRHIWPYGLNYDNEWSELNADRHVMLMQAMVRDGQ